jgi:hypothetical protein
MSNPQMHNMYEVYRNMYEALGIKEIDKILNETSTPTTKGPCVRTH